MRSHFVKTVKHEDKRPMQTLPEKAFGALTRTNNEINGGHFEHLM